MPHIHAAKRYMTDRYVPPCLPAARNLRDAPPFWSPVPRLAGAGSLCHNRSNTLRYQQQQLADILVQVPPNNCSACCRVAGGHGGCAAWKRFFGALFSIFSPHRRFFFYYMTCENVSPVSGLSGSDGHWATRERAAPEDSCAAVRAASCMCCCCTTGGVQHKLQNYMQWE